uniref:Pre-mRNA-splicing factor SLU7 n=1 Tax=Callorhinchus milii TaxID=7868 RepID=A0A4W3JXL9_CALMI
MAASTLTVSAEAQRLKETRRKKKEVEEQRKLGLVPAETDEDGRDINPHIPEYISTVPWYVDSTNIPSLKHQRPHLEKQNNYNTIKDWYIHNLKGNQTTRYRRGACENCGAITHMKKECMERPRKVGAKYTATNIAPDEYTQPQLFFDYDGKRDRWNGFDPEQQKKIIAEYEKINIVRKLWKLAIYKLQKSLLFVTSSIIVLSFHEEEEEEDEDKYADEFDMPGQKVDSKMRITVRNLRIREDTAKYLKNLDLNSAYYDPYSRSMRENPYAASGKNSNENGYIAENVLRLMGDASTMAQSQLFAWEAYEHGVDVHLQSDPTKLEMLHKSFIMKDEEFKKGQRESIIEKYGAQDYLEPPSRMLLLAQTEEYTEYSKHGFPIKGHLKAIAKSKYEEDVYVNNHTTIWGSYWKNGNWGYKCCHSFVKHSYCSDESGRKEIIDLMTSQESFPCVVKQHLTTKCSLEVSPSLSSAFPAEEEQLKKVDKLMRLDERKRPYNCMHDGKQSMEAEIEAYQIKRQRPEDPMCAFLEKI